MMKNVFRKKVGSFLMSFLFLFSHGVHASTFGSRPFESTQLAISGGTIMHATDSGNVEFAVGGTTEALADIFLGVTGDAYFNKQSNDADFRINGQTVADMFRVDASVNRIAMGFGTPLAFLDIHNQADADVALNIRESINQSVSSLTIQEDDGTILLAVTSDTDLVLGSSGTANANIVLSNNGAATFNKQQANVDFIVSSDTLANAFKIAGATGIPTIQALNCSANANGGALTADLNGVISCTDDDSGAGGSTEWTDAGTFLHPADASGVEDLVLGGTTVAAADHYLAADGSAVFNEQGAAVNLRFEGDTDPDLLFLQGAVNTVTIGSQISLGKFGIDGDADQIQLVVQGNATQTNPIIVVEKSDGTDLFKVDNAGVATFGGTGERLTFPTNGEFIDGNDASDGEITFGGAGQTNNESFRFDFETTANNIRIESGSGVTAFNFVSIDVLVPTEAYDDTGWNGDLTVPTKDSIRDLISAIAGKGLTLTSNVLDSDGFILASSANNSGSNNFDCPLPGQCTTSVGNELEDIIPSSMSGTLKNLYARVRTAPGVGKSWAITVFVNNSAQPLTCTIADTATTCNDTSNTVAVTAEDRLGLRVVGTGTPASTTAFGISATFVPA